MQCGKGLWLVGAGLLMLATGSQGAGQPAFQDCPQCPRMQPLPGGQFAMGIEPGDELAEPDQQPRRRVQIREPFAMGVHEVTRAQFAHFVEASGHRARTGCNFLEGVEWVLDPKRDWRDPGYPQAPTHPVVCASWQDAVAYAEWLSTETGHRYRLPSEAEWEYAARAGQPAGAAENRVSRRRGNHGTRDCCGPRREGDDVWDYTAPVGSLQANAFGLHDTQGNVWEWVADCYHDSYAGAPVDGSARQDQCSLPEWRVVRGGSWGDDSYFLQPTYRLRAPATDAYFTLGFRVARELPPRDAIAPAGQEERGK